MPATAVHPLLSSRRAEILGIASRCGISHLRVFGSFARGEDRPDSDIDLLVDLEPGRSLLDLIAAKQDIEDLLGRKVDIITARSLSPHVRDSVSRDALWL
jgi:predicted nucleotidyltransferase